MSDHTELYDFQKEWRASVSEGLRDLKCTIDEMRAEQVPKKDVEVLQTRVASLEGDRHKIYGIVATLQVVGAIGWAMFTKFFNTK